MKKLLALLLTIVMMLSAFPVTLFNNPDLFPVAKAASYTVGDIIQYGTYPQMLVTDRATIAKLNAIDLNWVSYRYYTRNYPDNYPESYEDLEDYLGRITVPNDFMKFADFFCEGKKYRAVKFDAYRPSDPYTGYMEESPYSSYDDWAYYFCYQRWNGYKPDTIYYFEYEPLSWRILDPETGYIICESIIDSQPFNNISYYEGSWQWNSKDNVFRKFANDYASSSLFEWLNQDFYQTAFTNEQSNNIVQTTVYPDVQYNTLYYTKNTVGKIHLLSSTETINSAYGFNTDFGTEDTEKQAKGTDYAKSQGLHAYMYDYPGIFSEDVSPFIGNACWWLRSNLEQNAEPSYLVDYSGSISNSSVYYSEMGVRPVCHLSELKSDTTIADSLFSEIKENGYDDIDVNDDETLSGTVSFSTGDSSGSTTVSFNSGYVAGDSLNYHHDLAQLCSQIVTVGYSKDESTIRNMLQTIGFSSDGNYIKSAEGETKSTESHVNNFIAHRDVTISGEEYHVLLVACIGSNRRQWYNNFQPGTGEVHAGFQQAADYMKKQIDGYLKNRNWTKENTKIIFTGHSRGAAVSNLLAADFILNGKYAKPENIYAYTFATPNNTSTKKIAKSAAKCKRIYNFVNPEDFVTYVLLSKWGYGKYGQTLVLPSKTNEYNYSSYKRSMQNYFAVLTEGLVYNPYPNGMDTTTTIINKVFSRVPVITNFDKKQFRTTLLKKVSLQDFFLDYICAILAEIDGGIVSKGIAGNATKNLIVTAFSPTADGLLEDVADYFMLGWETVKDDFTFDFSIVDLIRVNIPGLSIRTINNMKRFLVDPMAGYFKDAHRAETYCAYLLSMTREQAYDQGVVRANRKYCVRCPIDVEIYDNATGNLVGKIIDNVVDETVAAQEDAVVMSVEQEEKTFSLPANGDYEIKLLGNDSGTMNVTVESTDYQTGEEERVNYYDIPVSKTSEFHLTQPSEEASVQEVTLTDEKGQEIQIAQTVSSEEYDTLTVHVTTEGIGSVSAPSVATAGDYVIMEAETDRNNEFLGWYSKDGKQLGSDPVYSVIAKANIEIVARFSNNKGKEISSIELDASPKYIVGKADDITAIPLKVTPDGVTLSQLSFTMTDESIADLMASDDGFYLIGKTPGKTVLEIKSEDGKKTFSFYVIVIAPEDTSVIFVPGDVDGNGAVESADARMALRGSVKLENIEKGTAAFMAADADGNGVLEAGDARLILRASVKLEALPLTSAA